MKKTVVVLLIASMFCATAFGCTNIQDDGTRTKTEGTLAGAGIGAAIGAGLGALIGGKRGALLGAGIGAGVGAAGGYAVGAHVAEKKSEYASQEAWLDACVAQAADTNNQLKTHNQTLSAEIKSIDSETARLKKAYAEKTVYKSTLNAENKKIQQKIQQNKELIAMADQEILGQGKALEDAKAGGKNDYVKSIDAEIAALKRQKAQLQESNTKLTAMSSRISV